MRKAQALSFCEAPENEESSTLDRSLTPLILPTTAGRFVCRASVLQDASLAVFAAKRGA